MSDSRRNVLLLQLRDKQARQEPERLDTVQTPEPRFRVVTASVDGKPVRSPYGGMSMAPQFSIAEVVKAGVSNRERPREEIREAMDKISGVTPVVAGVHADPSADATMAPSLLKSSFPPVWSPWKWVLITYFIGSDDSF